MPLVLLLVGVVLLCIFWPAGIALIVLAIAWAVIFQGRPKVVVQQHGMPTPSGSYSAPSRAGAAPAPSGARGFAMITFSAGLASLLAVGGFVAGMQYARNQAEVDGALSRL